MGIDSYFVIGTAHSSAGEPCQDFAMHGDNFGVIADGCSSSKGHPDIGARLAGKALAKALSVPVLDPDMPRRTLLDGLAKALGTGLVDKEDLLATTGGFRVDPEGVQAWLWGDGVIYVEYADGSVELKVIEAENNMPLYPVYLLDRDAPVLRGTVNGVEANDVLPYYWDFRKTGQPIRNFLMATDGLTQIADLAVDEAIAQFTAFKTTEGAFLKRRMIRALKNMSPRDDLGVVAYHEKNIC